MSSPEVDRSGSEPDRSGSDRSDRPTEAESPEVSAVLLVTDRVKYHEIGTGRPNTWIEVDRSALVSLEARR